MKGTVNLSLIFCLLWFLSNYFYNCGLEYASITSSEILSNTSPMWVYVITLSCLVPVASRERFDPVKVLMIVVSLGGFGLIAIQDYKTGQAD